MGFTFNQAQKEAISLSLFGIPLHLINCVYEWLTFNERDNCLSKPDMNKIGLGELRF